MCTTANDHLHKRINGLPAKIGHDSVVLILGTLPGKRSLITGTYYADPSNKFGDILFMACGEKIEKSDTAKDILLKKCGVLMEAVLEGMAEYYSVELAQKIKRGMDINAEKCLSTGGNLALGFKTEGKRIVVDPLTAPIVVKIFEMYVTGSTMADIIRYLNANQIKTSYGNEFNKNSINRILKNKRYIGIYTYRDKEIPDGLPRIVDDGIFGAAQRIMEKNKKAPARAKAKVDYLLTTKLFCGHCKAAMTGISGTSKTERK